MSKGSGLSSSNLMKSALALMSQLMNVTLTYDERLDLSPGEGMTWKLTSMIHPAKRTNIETSWNIMEHLPAPKPIPAFISQAPAQPATSLRLNDWAPWVPKILSPQLPVMADGGEQLRDHRQPDPSQGRSSSPCSWQDHSYWYCCL